MITPSTQGFAILNAKRVLCCVSSCLLDETELEFIFDVSTTQFPYKLFCVFHGKIQQKSDTLFSVA